MERRHVGGGSGESPSSIVHTVHCRKGGVVIPGRIPVGSPVGKQKR
jgi:hypothetical protein